MDYRNELSWTSLLQGLVESEAFHGVFHVYHQMWQEKVHCSKYTLVPLVTCCTRLGYVEEGLQIHGEIIKLGFEKDEFLCNGLVSMYLRCGCLIECEELLLNSLHLQNYDVISWTSVLVGYLDAGLLEKALNLLERMQCEGVAPDRITCISGWKACGDIKAPNIGQNLHSFAFKVGMEMDISLENALLYMYAKCGFLEEAEYVFENVDIRDVITWTALSGGYVDHGLGNRALSCIEQMEIEGIAWDTFVLVLAIKACGNAIGSISKGYCVHAEVVKQGFDSLPFVGSALLGLYYKYNLITEANGVLNTLALRDTVSWNTMISGYIEVGFSEEALRCLQEMQLEGVTQDQVTFFSGLKASGDIGDLEKGTSIHIHITRIGFDSDVTIGNMLVYMYAKCGFFLDAMKVFENLPIKDVTSWTSLSEGYADYGFKEEALELFEKMQLEGISMDDVSLYFSLQLLGSIRAPDCGQKIHITVVKKGFDKYSFLGNALVEMYARCGLVIDARDVLENVSFQEAASWNALIKTFVDESLYEDAVNCFKHMELKNVSPDVTTFIEILNAFSNLKDQLSGLSLHAAVMKKGLEKDLSVANALVEMYATCMTKKAALEIFYNMLVIDPISWNVFINKFIEEGHLEEALDILQQMQSKGLSLGKVTWMRLISAYVEHGETEKALTFCRKMQEQGLAPDSGILVSIVKGCGNEALLEIGKRNHAQVIAQVIARQEVIGVDLATSFVDMYAKCGNMTNAQDLFDSIPTLDIMTWDALIRGYVYQGESLVVFHLFERLVQTSLHPDGVIFLAILTLCMHVGLLEKAHSYFEVMRKEYVVTPGIKHFACVIDLLGRAGQINEAVRIIGTMPFHPNLVMWHTILGACQKLGNVELGKWAFLHALQLDKSHAITFILMCNIYIDAQMWMEVEEIEALRNQLREGFCG